jgi:hypothetical protein
MHPGATGGAARAARPRRGSLGSERSAGGAEFPALSGPSTCTQVGPLGPEAGRYRGRGHRRRAPRPPRRADTGGGGFGGCGAPGPGRAGGGGGGGQLLGLELFDEEETKLIETIYADVPPGGAPDWDRILDSEWIGTEMMALKVPPLRPPPPYCCPYPCPYCSGGAHQLKVPPLRPLLPHEQPLSGGSRPPPPPLPRTNRTSLVPPTVLTGQVSSLPPY